jgi:phosphatidylserine decarboxylase
MLETIKAYIQYFLPKRLLTTLAGCIAQSRRPGLKNFIIQRFIKRYSVDMSQALIEDPEKYENFNRFFTRQLKPELRPVTQVENEIASPVDGVIAQLGQIKQNQLLQAKNFYFDLETLLGNDTPLAELFHDGVFATLYLAPRDYHRVHMPLAGKLEKTLYVPGKLFSVNKMTSDLIPQLYSRNERLICVFDTAAGPMAVIFVGAMIVGSIKTVWMDQPVREQETQPVSGNIQLAKGAELGQFMLGSTIILLFKQNQAEWSELLSANSAVKFGQFLGKIRE